MIQWPTVVHATAYVVELYEETAQTVERFHSAWPWVVALKPPRTGARELEGGARGAASSSDAAPHVARTVL